MVSGVLETETALMLIKNVSSHAHFHQIRNVGQYMNYFDRAVLVLEVKNGFIQLPARKMKGTRKKVQRPPETRFRQMAPDRAIIIPPEFGERMQVSAFILAFLQCRQIQTSSRE